MSFPDKTILAKDLQLKHLLKVSDHLYLEVKKIGRVGSKVAVSHFSDKATLYSPKQEVVILCMES